MLVCLLSIFHKRLLADNLALTASVVVAIMMNKFEIVNKIFKRMLVDNTNATERGGARMREFGI